MALNKFILTRKRWVLFIVFYAILSLTCYFALSIPMLKSFFNSMWNFVWIFGPPSNLLHKNALLFPFIIETLILFTCIINIKSTNRLALLFLFLTILVWLISGCLTIAVLI